MEPDICISTVHLRFVLKELGFCWRKTTDNRQIVTERADVTAARARFLRDIRKYRDKGFSVVYTDETWVNQNHCRGYTWLPVLHKCGMFSDKEDGVLNDVTKLPNIPSGKGQRLIILHAGNKDEGFLPNCDLVFVGKHDAADYHSEMNTKTFMEWFETKLIPALKVPSVIVLDNAVYHNKRTEDSISPNMSHRKAVMQEWLQSRSIAYEPKFTKPELYQLIKRNKPTPVYVTDVLAKQHGHVVLRTPVRQCEFNAIELIWAKVKHFIADRNTTFKIKDVKELVPLAFSNVSTDDWAKAVEHTEKIENYYWKTEGLREEIDQVIIHLDSDTYSCSDFSSSGENSDSSSEDSSA